MSLKILADAALPNAKEVFSSFGEVIVKEGRKITADDLVDIDALIIRSVTKVNEKLLTKAQKLKFVGTATAGCDHVNVNLLKNLGIAFFNAPGSNKESVGDYILSLLLVMSLHYDLDFKHLSLGIIGCGNTGSQVEHKAHALNLKVVKCDPIRLKNGDSTCSATFDEALACDIVTFHVPLNKDGPYQTYHMLNAQNLNKLKEGCFLINASRGDVIDNEALVTFMQQRPDIKLYLDVFEGEPEITHKELLNYVQGASAHIAGYSYESKRRASYMLAQNLADTLKLENHSTFSFVNLELKQIILSDNYQLDLNLIRRLVFSVYDVREDLYLFKNYFKGRESFDLLRKNYRERHELQTLTLKNVKASDTQIFKNLGFNCQ